MHQKTSPWASVWRFLRDPTFSRTPTFDRRMDRQTDRQTDTTTANIRTSWRRVGKMTKIASHLTLTVAYFLTHSVVGY